MAILKLSASAVNAELDALTSLFNVGGAGSIEFRTGVQPLAVADAPTGIVVGVSNLSATAFGPAVNGVSTANPISASSVAPGGGPFTLTWARIYDGAGTAIMDVDVGVGTTFTINIANSTTVNTGESIVTNSFQLTQGGI